MVVQLLSGTSSASQQLHLLTLVSALAGGSEECSNELGEAGVGAVLLHMISTAPLPRTQVQCCCWLLCMLFGAFCHLAE